MQGAFLASLASERKITPQAGADVDETALPPDVRQSLDRGLAEASAEFDKPANRDQRARILATASIPPTQRMATLQSALDTTFAGLRAPCVPIIEKYRADHVVVTPARPASLATTSTAPAEPFVYQGDSPTWQGSQWIEVGVIERPTGVGGSWDPKTQWPGETTGLSERTEIQNRSGKNRRVALLGPFIDSHQVHAFCVRLKAHGGACGGSVTRTLKAAQLSAARRSAARRIAAQAKGASPAAKTAPVTLASGQGVQDLTAGLRGRLSE
jgi:hypothetical protein